MGAVLLSLALFGTNIFLATLNHWIFTMTTIYMVLAGINSTQRSRLITYFYLFVFLYCMVYFLYIICFYLEPILFYNVHSIFHCIHRTCIVLFHMWYINLSQGWTTINCMSFFLFAECHFIDLIFLFIVRSVHSLDT